MKTTIIILSIALIAVVVAVIRMRRKGVEIKSFWDVVRNPGAMPDLKQYHKDVEDAATAITGSETEIRGLVDYFVFEAKSSHDAWTEKRILAKLGAEAFPRALEILRDSTNHDRLVILTVAGNFSLPEAPICRLAEIFDLDVPPPLEAASLLALFLRCDSAQIRKSVALTIGSIGSSRSLPDLQLALKDEDDYVRSYALMGIQRAISGERIKVVEKAQFYDAVAEMWPKDRGFSVCDSLPKILLRLDRERAIERLLQPDLFTAQFEPVWRILEALAEESVEVPRSRLLALIEEASIEPIKYPMDNVMEGALALLGRHRIAEDLLTLERLLDYPNEKISRGAIKGLYAYHRYFEVIRNPRDVEEADGWDALTDAEKHVCAIETLDAEVNNGGFAQYYFNSSADRWQDALNGLAAIGAHKRRETLAATIAIFGQTKPSTDRETRNAQLSKIVRKKEDPFREQDNGWYKTDSEPLERLIFRYNLANMHGRKKAELGDTEQPATHRDTDIQDDDKPQPDAEGKSR